MRNESLSEHHRDLAALCTALRDRIDVADRTEFISAFRVFERAVLAHLRLEERELLPAYEQANPADAARIRAAHRDLRAYLLALAVDIELHTVRAERLEHCLATLQALAAHENAGLYPWASAHLDAPVRLDLTGRIARSIRALRRAARFGHTTAIASPLQSLQE